ncbi:hypothetical protein X777_09027 [Ooceraea biroi]|uniref:Uncharacterized protein n=1 Tax=Ooceraea biroi TaxID=2015173 RepID=A0A026W8C5_OOCBI|nr:hypothetical protein X777_09027 [Ooceraea biroi]
MARGDHGSGVAGNGTSTPSRSAALVGRCGGVGLTERKGLGRAEQDPKVVLHGQRVQSHLVLACLAHSPPGLELLTSLFPFLTLPLCLSLRPAASSVESSLCSIPSRFDVDHYRQTFRDAPAVQMQHYQMQQSWHQCF